MLMKVRYKLKLVMLAAFLPSLLIVASETLNPERFLASVPQFRNWGLENKVSDSHIHAVEAWKIEDGSRNTVVAVIDTGVDVNHPDLKNNIWKDKESGIYGWDFVENKPNPIDQHSHGTHVAGILGAILNVKAGISGVAHKVSIMPVKYYSDKNSGTQNLHNSIKAINWAVDHGAQIINYSGGGPEFSAGEFEAIKHARDKGVLVVAAAGNERQNSDLAENYYYPCAYKLDNIICVAATNIRNEMLASSNWGKERVDVAAPGENILSTVPGGRYAYMSGTSQATAFVSGLAALLISKNKNLKPFQVKEFIRNSVDHIAKLKDKVFAGGKVNAEKALVALNQKMTVQPQTQILTKAEFSSPQSGMIRAISSPKQKVKKVLKNK